MFSLGSSHCYYLYGEPTDMRKSFDELAGVVHNKLHLPLTTGQVFVFINKRRDRVKLLHWEAGGFVLYYKRLEQGVLERPRLEGKAARISWPQLVMMVEGIWLEAFQKTTRYEDKKGIKEGKNDAFGYLWACQNRQFPSPKKPICPYSRRTKNRWKPSLNYSSKTPF